MPDIDIDIEADKDDVRFKNLLKDVERRTAFPFQHWITVDKNYDNYVMEELTVENQVLSIYTTHNLKLFNRKSGTYELFYKNGIPNPEIVLFEGLRLSLLPPESVLKMKEALAKKKAIDRSDISGMRRLLESMR